MPSFCMYYLVNIFLFLLTVVIHLKVMIKGVVEMK